MADEAVELGQCAAREDQPRAAPRAGAPLQLVHLARQVVAQLQYAQHAVPPRHTADAAVAAAHTAAARLVPSSALTSVSSRLSTEKLDESAKRPTSSVAITA